MRYGLNCYAEPAVEPISLAEAKSHLRVTFADEDAAIAGMIVAARQWIEEQTYRQLVTATWDLVLDEFPSGDDKILVPRAPLQTVSAITYTDMAGDQQTLDPTLYVVSNSRQPGVIRPAYGQVWPTALDTPDAVTVRFVAGYGNAGQVPELLRAAIKLLVGQMYEIREPVVPQTMHEVPLGLARILQMYDLGDELSVYGSQ